MVKTIEKTSKKKIDLYVSSMDKKEQRRLKRESKRKRIKESKANNTYVYRKVKPVINKWGKPFYELERQELEWIKKTSNRGSYATWVNPITKQTIYGLVTDSDPEPQIHYRWVSTGKMAEIKPVYHQPKLVKLEESRSGLTMPVFNK